MKQLTIWFKTNYTPLQQLLIVGFVVRLFSVFFSKGFGWHDDHFLIIEAAQSWVDGFDYNDWLPSESHPERQAQGHPLFYVGINYVFFYLNLLDVNILTSCFSSLYFCLKHENLSSIVYQ